MSFSIVKVRSSLNYSLIELKLKNIWGSIKDKMNEIHLKYRDILCRLLIFIWSQAYSWYYQCKTDNICVETYNSMDPSATGDHFHSINTPSYCGSKCNGQHLHSINNAVTLQVLEHRATPLLHEERRQISGPSAMVIFNGKVYM